MAMGEMRPAIELAFSPDRFAKPPSENNSRRAVGVVICSPPGPVTSPTSTEPFGALMVVPAAVEKHGCVAAKANPRPHS